MLYCKGDTATEVFVVWRGTVELRRRLEFPEIQARDSDGDSDGDSDVIGITRALRSTVTADRCHVPAGRRDCRPVSSSVCVTS